MLNTYNVQLLISLGSNTGASTYSKQLLQISMRRKVDPQFLPWHKKPWGRVKLSPKDSVSTALRADRALPGGFVPYMIFKLQLRINYLTKGGSTDVPWVAWKARTKSFNSSYDTPPLVTCWAWMCSFKNGQQKVKEWKQTDVQQPWICRSTLKKNQHFWEQKFLFLT